MKLITSKTCTKCRQFKKMIVERQLPVDIEDVEEMNTREYNELIQTGIMSLPVLKDDNGAYVALANASQTDFLKRFEEF